MELFMMRQLIICKYLVCAFSTTHAAQHRRNRHLNCNSLLDECVADKAPVQKGLPCDRRALLLQEAQCTMACSHYPFIFFLLEFSSALELTLALTLRSARSGLQVTTTRSMVDVPERRKFPSVVHNTLLRLIG